MHLTGRYNELFVPIVKVKRRRSVQSCENGLRRKLRGCLRLKRRVRLSVAPSKHVIVVRVVEFWM